MHFRLAVIAAFAIAFSAHAGIVDENFWRGHCVPLRRGLDERSHHRRLLGRQRLRVYSCEGPQQLTILAEGGTATALLSQPPCGGAPACTEPWYAEVDLNAALPSLAGQESARISMIGRNIWGFISITHNESQHLTVATPGTSVR